MSRKNSDFLFFSVVLLMAVFAAPAIAGPCLTLGECPAPVASDCHDEEGEGTDSCWCGVEAVPDATRETLKHKDSVWLAESPQMLGAAGKHISALRAALMPPSPPPRGGPLFVLNSSFLI